MHIANPARASREAIDRFKADRQHRRDLVPFSDVLREFGPDVAYREARVPGEVIQQQIEEIFAERGYAVDPEVRS